MKLSSVISKQIGARSLGSVDTGLPDDLAPTDSSRSGLSSGAIAGIIILILVIAIAVLATVAILVYIYAVKNRRGKYFVSATGGISIMNPANVKRRETSEQELTMSQSMKEKEEGGISASTVVKSHEEAQLESDKIDETKEVESRIDAEPGKEDEKEKKGSDSSNDSSDDSSDDESKKKRPDEDDEDNQNTRF